jgi:hypothetical protein
MKALALALFLFPFITLAEEAPRVEILATQAERELEYCRTETEKAKYGCNTPSYPVARISLPQVLGEKITAAIDHSLALSYADNLDLYDLFHGHFIFGGPQAHYESPSALLGDLRVVLFHSAEYLHRWAAERKAGIPIPQRRPRSFVTALDGRVEPAISWIRPGVVLQSYETAGTVYTDELVASRPELSSHRHHKTGGMERLYVKICQSGTCETCRVEPALYLIPSQRGSFLTAKGERLELYFRCRFEP